MDYTPRYQQPFTLHEAIALDISIINEEISRLQNSLQKLGETQSLLKEEQRDPEIKEAYEENEQVIGSQKERIAILKMALTEKGVLTGSHYQPAQQAPDAPEPAAVTDRLPISSGIDHVPEDSTDSNEDGVFL